ncbi:hypothetical protein JTB14_013245 [Gonioctena quinquepunctata]|nr:hypothetical protein JTB14_013245 [Gonioctena quinquepunctata]
MGATNFPTIYMYWNANFKLPLISNVMPRDEFYLLRVNFHVVDNLAVDDEMRKNKLWKVQPIIDFVKNGCRQIQRKPNASYSTDEQMIPFLGRCPVRQYVKNTLMPVRLKIFVLTTSKGIVLDFEIYQGPTTNLLKQRARIGPSVIFRLVETVPNGSSIFFDRYFSTVPLMKKLTQINIDGIATIMSNRVKGCNFRTDKEINRKDCDQLVRSDKKNFYHQMDGQ